MGWWRIKSFVTVLQYTKLIMTRAKLLVFHGEYKGPDNRRCEWFGYLLLEKSENKLFTES